jgi:hypothetical protein
VTLRGGSVSAYLMAKTMNTGSGDINKTHNQFTAENDGGQLAYQNEAEAEAETTSQTRERMTNNRVFGLRTDWR